MGAGPKLSDLTSSKQSSLREVKYLALCHIASEWQSYFAALCILVNMSFQSYCNTGDWTQDLALARVALYHLCHTLSFFSLLCVLTFFFFCSTGGWTTSVTPSALFVLLCRVLLYAWASLNCSLPVHASLPSWDDRHVPPGPVIGWDGGLTNFSLGWSQTAILPISVSQVARITGMSHCTQPCVLTFAGSLNTEVVQDFLIGLIHHQILTTWLLMLRFPSSHDIYFEWIHLGVHWHLVPA
jgi:hypothetical protein